MKYDVTAMGELLIDFTQNGITEQGNGLFEANPGGAPCNVLAMLAKLGKKAAFIGKVGDDLFGRLLFRVIAEAGIDAGGLVFDPSVRTTLSFVRNTPDGDRDFSFYRNPGADQRITPAEVRTDLIRQSGMFHFGTLSLTDEPARSATQAAVETAARAGALISFDPNLRPPLWPSLEEAKKQMAWGCGRCAVLKIAAEELAFLAGEDAVGPGIASLRGRFPGIALFLVTKGKDGAEAFYGGVHVSVPAYREVRTIDTTGAGDTFCGACLAYLLDHDPDRLTEEQLTEMLKFANAAAALVTAKKGALRSMPSRGEILRLMGEEDPLRG